MMASKTSRKSSTPTPAPTTSSPRVARGGSSERKSTLSPTRLTRLQEKLELQSLNDRLAAYIDRVRCLETENSKLSIQVQTSQDVITREVTSLKTMYERELTEARRMLDETAREKARLQIDASNAKAELDDAKHKLHKREKDFSNAEKKLINSEALVQDLQTRLSQITSEKKRHDELLKDAESDRDRIAKQLLATKTQLEEEMVYRVDLLNKIQSVQEELTFKETIHEREMSESRVIRQSDVSDFDINLKEHYEEKLAETLRAIRDQYETQMKINRDEIESLYETKLSDLQNICDNYSKNASGSQNELRLFRSKVEALTSKVSELESQTESLRGRIKDLESLLEQEREWHAMGIQAKDDEIQALRKDVERQLQEYQDLLDIKVALDMEIAAYRKLLEVEETRLHISPTPDTPRESQERSTPVRRTPLRGKRKRFFMETGGEKLSSDIQSSSSAKGEVEINDHDQEGKFVKILNKGSADVSLGGWQLIRKAGEQETMYKFPRTITIKASSIVTVWSSDSGTAHSPPSDLVMRGQKWFTADSMSTTLLNNEGEEMAVRESSKRMHRSSEQRIMGSHFSEELYHQQGDPENPQERCAIM